VALAQVIAKSTDRGVDTGGVTLEGFLFLHRLFVERGRLETT
jgi:Ras family protein T1